ncbi:hypothetical protein D9M69_535620 [compost metagenome]
MGDPACISAVLEIGVDRAIEEELEIGIAQRLGDVSLGALVVMLDPRSNVDVVLLRDVHHQQVERRVVLRQRVRLALALATDPARQFGAQVLGILLLD